MSVTSERSRWRFRWSTLVFFALTGGLVWLGISRMNAASEVENSVNWSSHKGSVVGREVKLFNGVYTVAVEWEEQGSKKTGEARVGSHYNVRGKNGESTVYTLQRGDQQLVCIESDFDQCRSEQAGRGLAFAILVAALVPLCIGLVLLFRRED